MLLAAAVFLPLAALAATATAAAGPEEHIFVRDSVFRPPVLRIAPGTTVIWHEEGRNPHTITADDGSWDSGYLTRGQTYRRTFDQTGRYAYYCKAHGAADGKGMAGLILVGDVADVAVTKTVKTPRPEGPLTIRVPADAPTVQSGVDLARPGDLVLISPGVYHESVAVLTPDITLRGLDRNQVILDGQFTMDNGVKVLGADGVVVENMTARHYTLNGFYWTGVKGYRGSYLTAYNNGDYGVYAFDSVNGQFDHSYASGNPDSGFYIGQCKPCHAVITDVISENNGLAYSGTNAGGDLTLMNSLWQNNLGGIAPNTLDTERLAPQEGTRIVGNVIRANGNERVPTKAINYPSMGTGVVLAGGIANVVEGNTIEDNATYGVLVTPNIDKKFWLAVDNVVRYNRITGSGRADLALAAPAGTGNCFAGNSATSSQPPAIDSLYACGSALAKLGGGEFTVTMTTLARFVRTMIGSTELVDWKTMTPPSPQPNMPDPQGRPAPAWPTPEYRQVPAAIAAAPAPAPAPARGEFAGGTLLAISPWWVLLFGLYAYLLPIVLYTCWVTVSVWDIFRRDDRFTGWKLGWLAGVLLVPGLGPVGYLALGKSAIPRALRLALVVGGLGLYLALATASLFVAAI